MTAWGPLHAHLHQTLRSPMHGQPDQGNQGLLPAGSSLLIALSGGQDSQCLLRLLVDLQAKWGWSLQSIHCNHGWRADAAANAAFVMAQAAQWGIPCLVKTADCSPVSEAAARHWRYHVFATVARELHCTHVVTGHTASDRAETLLYNLIRGSGADGLQALTRQRPLAHPGDDIRLVRPLLEITRAQTGQFCQDYGMPVWEDATNRDLRYARNRLRLDVFPLLRDHFNPQVEVTLAQTAELLTADVAYLEAVAQELREQCTDGHRVQRRQLRDAPLALQRRVLRQVLQQQLPSPPRFEHIDKLVMLLAAPNRSQSDPFPGGAIAIVEDPWIKFSFP